MKTEKMVYVCNCDNPITKGFDFRTSEHNGDYETIKKNANYKYTLQEFADEVNDEELYLTNSFIYIE